MSLTAKTLQRAMPGLSAANAARYAPALSHAMRERHITTRRRAAAFLAQLGHESVSLRYMEEIASGAAYEGRRDLGNTHPGDGRRYKGRGPIQLTGRANYRLYGNLLRLPLEAHPDLAARPSVGFRIAALYWERNGLNALADRGDFRAITHRINGGYNGLADRLARWARIKALGSQILPETAEQAKVKKWAAELAKIRRAVRKIGHWTPKREARAKALERVIAKYRRKR